MRSYEKTQVFTTGQISKICQVAPRTVSKWFDTGRLRGYRIPGSNDRRVPRENLVVFMKEHGIPLGPLSLHESSKVLLVGVAEEVESELRAALPDDLFEVQYAETAFEAGSLTTAWSPHCLVIDAGIGREECEGMVRALRRALGDRAPKLIALVPADGDAAQLDTTLFDDRFRAPFDSALLAARIQHASKQATAKA
ncbi:MAG: hypothetical protein KDA75_21020 [Planctomycetaceae bacterium]|nr:hypothetical protein [Planctomycetaceae bacterium]